jgi:hypothetical protein
MPAGNSLVLPFVDAVALLCPGSERSPPARRVPHPWKVLEVVARPATQVAETDCFSNLENNNIPPTVKTIFLLALTIGVASCANGRSQFEQSYQAMVSAENRAIRDSTPPLTNEASSIIKFNVISLVGERTEKEASELESSYRQLIEELSSCSEIRGLVEELTRKHGAVVPFPILTPTSKSFPWESCFSTVDYKKFTAENHLPKTNAARYLWNIED